MSKRIGQAVGYGMLIWIIGFFWGTVVFVVPALKNLPSIPWVSKYPAISFPLLVVFWLVAAYYARRSLAGAQDKKKESLQFGIILAGVNFILDVLVLVWLFGNGSAYFMSLTVWLSYAILLYVPIRTGKTLA